MTFVEQSGAGKVAIAKAEVKPTDVQPAEHALNVGWQNFGGKAWTPRG